MSDTKNVPTTYEFFLGIADRFGVPCLILAAVLWMVRDAGMVLHQTVLTPVIQSHTKFLDRTGEALDKLSDTQEKQEQTLRVLAAGQEKIEAAVLRPVHVAVPN